jgi:outer membrane protein OmpA-like peptidoglycan-associated protein
MAFDALSGFTDVVSTKEFVNQMATTLVGVKEWALLHDKEVISILKQTYTACNQIKQYDEWAVKASEAIQKTYNFETPEYWYYMFKGIKVNNSGFTTVSDNKEIPTKVAELLNLTKAKDNDYNIGGTRVFNYADAMQYYGEGPDKNNRYKAVYEQVSAYLTGLNPCGFNESNPDGVVAYDDAVNLYFLGEVGKQLNDTGKAEKISYAGDKTQVLANGQWNINFETGSTAISGSTRDLETIYNLLVQAEETKLKVVGHTDNVGNPASNIVLSKGRANSVVTYLTGRGISVDRFQLVDGKGDASPIADNSTSSGKAKNRRVEITLLK